MTKELLDYVSEKTRDLMAAPSCCPEAKAAAQAWLDAAGTDNEKAETMKYLAELEEDITSIDDLLAFASSEEAVEIFGADGAKGFLAHAQELKANGAKYCDCPACKAALAILNKKAELL
jgi:hypothetical protein